MKRVGLISYHSGHNYGTMLQAYALQRVINSLGDNSSEYIHYVDGKSFIDASWKVRLQKIIAKFKLGPFQLAYLFLYRQKLKTISEKFNSFFNSYITTSEESYSSIKELKETPPNYDIYIVGSDQTWNPTFIKDNSAYFLTFVKNPNATKNSYASSLGVYSISNETSKKYSKYLNSFNLISCREKINAEKLSILLKKKVEHVLDPTLLIDADTWKELEMKYDTPNAYVLCYCLGTKRSIRNFAKHLGEKHHLPVLYIVSSYQDLLYSNPCFGVGPLEFLFLIRNATYVCTDSFHGTIFSLIFKRNFYSFYKRKGGKTYGDNSRIFFLLQEMSLLNRLKSKEFIEEKDIDYNEYINLYLKEMKIKSISFLKQILEC